MILGILNSRPESIKGREIAGILGVTDRTVRSDIQILEDFLKEYDVSIEAVRGKGYRLIGKSQILLQQLVQFALRSLVLQLRQLCILTRQCQLLFLLLQ